MNKAPNHKKISAVRAAILNQDGKLLMLKRSLEQDSCCLCWEFPGGRCNDNEGIDQAFKRELCEETGIVAENFIQLVELEKGFISGGFYHGFLCENYLGIIEVEESDITISYEHVEYGWFDLSELQNLELAYYMKYNLKGFNKHAKKLK